MIMSEVTGKIIITRPDKSAHDFMRSLLSYEGYGFSADNFIIMPMLKIVPLPFSLPPITDIDGIIATSVNAIEIFAEGLAKAANGDLLSDSGNYRVHAPSRALGVCNNHCPEQAKGFFSLPLFTVGVKTKECAEDSGFNNILPVAKNSSELSNYINRINGQNKPKERLLYIRGVDVRHDFSKTLSKEKYELINLVVYKAAKVDAIDNESLNTMREGKAGAVMFFSVRTVQNFIEIARKYNLMPEVENYTALCISKDVRNCLPENWRGDILVAKRPDRESMIELLTMI